VLQAHNLKVAGSNPAPPPPQPIFADRMPIAD